MRRSALAIVVICLSVFLTRMAFGGGIHILWDKNPEDDLAGYKVYYKSSVTGHPYNGTQAHEGPSPIAVPIEDLEDVDNPDFNLTLLPDGTYYMVVTAYDTKGLESTYSNEVDTTLNSPPSAPSGVSSYGIAPRGRVNVNVDVKVEWE